MRRGDRGVSRSGDRWSTSGQRLLGTLYADGSFEMLAGLGTSGPELDLSSVTPEQPIDDERETVDPQAPDSSRGVSR